jgi:hypothetical protein
MVLAAAHRRTTVGGVETQPALVVAPPSLLIAVGHLRLEDAGGRPLPVLLLVTEATPCCGCRWPWCS